MSLSELQALPWPQLCERSRALLGPAAAKLHAADQRDALAAYYRLNPRVCRSLRAPEMDRGAYDEILLILRRLPWDRLSRRGSVAMTRLCAPRERVSSWGVRWAIPDSTASARNASAEVATTTQLRPLLSPSTTVRSRGFGNASRRSLDESTRRLSTRVCR